jgi:hypothetical protein
MHSMMIERSFFLFLLLLVLAFGGLPLSLAAFVPSLFSPPSRRISTGGSGIARSSTSSSSSSSPTTTDDDFASFAASFDDDDDDDDNLLNKKKKKKNGSTTTPRRSWKEDLEDLLDPTTPMTKRQNLLADLLSANQDIRQAVQTALREQKARSFVIIV